MCIVIDDFFSRFFDYSLIFFIILILWFSDYGMFYIVKILGYNVDSELAEMTSLCYEI